MNHHTRAALAIAALVGLGGAAAQPAANSIDSHLAAAKDVAGFEYTGTLARICITPQTARAATRAEPPTAARDVVHRAGQGVRQPVFRRQPGHSSWALTTSEGIILIDTLYEYASEELIVGGLHKLGLDPASVKYVLITHGHGDHVGGAKLMQDRFKARVVMGAPDWDSIERSVKPFPNGKPKRDIVAMDGQKITLGDTCVTLVATPGHTPGAFSFLFEVKDNGTPLTVAYNGGTAFNFINDVPHFDIYIASQRKMAEAATRRTPPC